MNLHVSLQHSIIQQPKCCIQCGKTQAMRYDTMLRFRWLRLLIIRNVLSSSAVSWNMFRALHINLELTLHYELCILLQYQNMFI